MAITRRVFLAASSAAIATAVAYPGVASAANPAIAALGKSPLIYLTPVLTNGKESKCHGEVWFVLHESDVFVSTQAGAWRAQAISRGLTRAKIWIGDFGAWTRANERYRSAPYLQLEGRLEKDSAVWARVLEHFGEKYASGWDSWGPRFRNGLADGTRVMLRYTVTS